MQYKILGKTGVRVSGLCFGTMSFGGDADEKTSAAMYHRCREAGINFFDCANVYQKGRAEEILGRLIAQERDELVIVSKVGGPMGEGPNQQGTHRKHITAAVEASLKRLGTDYIDVYFIHHPDHHTPLEETLAVMDDLVRQGKILYPAASNLAAWQAVKALSISAMKGWTGIACLQPMYNLVKRQAEVEILPMALSENLGIISYSPLGGGLLTGKYGSSQRPDSGRLMDSDMYRKRYADPMGYDVAEKFSGFAREQGFEPSSLAVAWVAAHPAITAPIIGARNVQQLEGSLKALDIDMTADLYHKVSAISPAPPLATDRAEEQV